MQLRDAVPDDAMDVARVHVRAWQQGFKDLLPATYLATLDPAERAARYTFGITDGSRPRTIVALEGGAIRGFTTIGLYEDEALLHALYVDPDAWGTGLGRALIAEARKDLRSFGRSSAILWSMVGNTRADRFYLADGWVGEGEHRVEDVWGTPVTQQRYRRLL
ncbi:MAG: GNAT family N-acetyltransferase [Kofleriaceae bacterium]